MLKSNPGYLSKLTAHEVIHLWQSEHWFGQLGSDRPWIHEGGAPALAIEMMYRIGIYDYSQYEDKWNDTEQECMEYLKETSIHSAPDNGMFDAVYPCGAMVNRLLGEALNPEDPGEGIIRFWKEMTVWRATARKTPSEKLFFRTLEKIGFSKEQLNCLYQLLTTSTDEPGELITHIRRKVRLQ